MRYFLLGLLILLLLILFAPFTLHVYYLEELKLKASFLIFSKNILPSSKKDDKEKKEKNKKTGKPKKAEETVQKEKAAEKKLALKEKFDLSVKILKELKVPFCKFLKRIRIKKVKLEIMAAASDAAKTADIFVKINEGALLVLNLLDSIFTLDADSICIYPDFREEKTKLYAECDIKINVIMFICLFVSILKTSGKDILKLTK